MKLKKQIVKEFAYLQRIPLFDPVFREAHGKKGIIVSIAVGIVVYCLAIIYVSPWESGYTEKEKNHLILYVCVAGSLAGPCVMSYIVEFCLSAFDLIKWKVDMKLKLNKGMKALALLIAALFASGVVLYSQPKTDIWGIFCFFMCYALIYLFVTYTWRWNYFELHEGTRAN
ncbi:MAG: hypothetical protein AAF546_03160 [Verrucomicrobiota bacterium]